MTQAVSKPPRGQGGRNQRLIRSMKLARWQMNGHGAWSLVGDSHFCETPGKGNSFWASAKALGLRCVRRKEGDGVRCWVMEGGK